MGRGIGDEQKHKHGTELRSVGRSFHESKYVANLMLGEINIESRRCVYDTDDTNHEFETFGDCDMTHKSKKHMRNVLYPVFIA